MAIQTQTQAQCQKSHSFIPICEGMIPRQSKSIGCCKVGNIGLSIVRQLLGASKRTGQPNLITQAWQATKLHQTHGMQTHQRFALNPTPRFHLANTLNVSRYSFMNACPMAISASNSGL